MQIFLSLEVSEGGVVWEILGFVEESRELSATLSHFQITGQVLEAALGVVKLILLPFELGHGAVDDERL